MKKLLSILVVGFLLNPAFSMTLNLTGFIIGSSSKTVDLYSDNTPVNAGEKYALVWTKDDAEFNGFNFDGTLIDSENSKVIVFLPAKKNHLGLTLVQFNTKDYTNGTFSVVLLDTRVKNVNTGCLDFFKSDSVTHIREYTILASGYQYDASKDLDRMHLIDSCYAQRIVANGYIEPETINPVLTPDFNTTEPTNAIANVGTNDENVIHDVDGNDDVFQQPTNQDSSNVVDVQPQRPVTPSISDLTNDVFDDVVDYVPERFRKKLLREKWKTMYKKHANEEWYHVWKKNYTRTSTYQKKIWIIKYSVYNIVPECYMNDKDLVRYKNRFTEHWVITSIYVMEKITPYVYVVTGYQVDENFGMIEVDAIECLKNERSRVLKTLRKMNTGKN